MQELEDRDNIKLVKYSPGFRDIVPANGGGCSGVTFFIDEAWFHLSSYVISKTVVFRQ
jgi:hypothetical protein